MCKIKYHTSFSPEEVLHYASLGLLEGDVNEVITNIYNYLKRVPDGFDRGYANGFDEGYYIGRRDCKNEQHS